MSDLNPLKQYIELFGKDKIFEWVFSIPSFFYKPRSFFQTVFAKSSEEKLSFSIFCVSIAALLYYLFSGLAFTTVLKQTVFEISVLIFGFLILNFTRLWLKKIYRVEVKSENLFYFLILTKSLTLPIQTIFFIIFNFSEKYELLFIHRLVYVGMLLFIIVYSNKIFYSKWKEIIFGILLNIFLFNIVLITFDAIKFDQYLTEYKILLQTDEVDVEFQKQIGSCENLWSKIPKNKFALELLDEEQPIFFYSFHKANVRTIGQSEQSSIDDEIKYRKQIIEKTNPDSVKKIKFRFRRNEIVYNRLIAFLNTIKNDIKTPVTDSTRVVEKIDLVDENEKKYGIICELTMNDEFYKKYNDFANEIIAFYHEKKIAEYPMYLTGIVAFPYAIYFYATSANPR